MTVPLVQGTLRYAWKTGHIGGNDNKPSDQSAKNSAEGSTFAAAVLPLVHACDAAAVKAALEKTYRCLGITCAHVGGLLSSDGVTPEAGMGGCLIAGYDPMGGSVQEHNEIDLDQAAMETALGAADFATAKTHYTQGGESQGSSGARTLQGFSTGAKSKMYDGCPGCPYKHYKQFYDYYGSFTYADDWALAALDGTTLTWAAPAPGASAFNFGDAHNNARKEAVKK